jgi:hypothetical protein
MVYSHHRATENAEKRFLVCREIPTDKKNSVSRIIGRRPEELLENRPLTDSPEKKPLSAPSLPAGRQVCLERVLDR